MTADNIIEILKVIGSLITTVAVPYMAYRMRQIERNTNSLVSSLVTKTEIVSEQKGKEKEQVAQKERDDAKSP